jgi:hypothetical protein
MNQKKNFNLNINTTNAVINNCLRPIYKSVTFATRASQTTESVYIDLAYSGIQRCVRLSSHTTSRPVKTVLVGKATKVQKIVSSIENVIKEMQTKSVQNAINSLRGN